MTISHNIFGSLHIAKQGMEAQQAGLNITGHNVANVNTEGYSRRLLSLSSRSGPPLGGGGVEIEGIKRYSDAFSTSRLIHEETLLGNAGQRGKILTQVSDLFNDLEEGGLGAVIDDFYGAFRLLEATPNDPAVRQEILARADQLSNTFQRISQEIEKVRANCDDLLRGSAADINIRTEEIAQLNEEISVARVQGIDISDLLDRRDQLIREIAQHVKVSVLEDDQQQVTLFLEGGLPLVDGKNQSLLQVRESAAPGTATVEYVTINGQVSEITTIIQNGSMGGVLDVRDNLLPNFADDLDQLAYDIVAGFNAQHLVGYGLDGVTARNFFTPLGSSANAANLIDLDAAVLNNANAIAAALDPALLPGDNRNALALAGLADQNLATGGTRTFNGAYAALVGEVGVAARRANDETIMRETAVSHVEKIRDSAAGVSMDEEMTNLIQYQRAYQASARVLSVINEILQTLVNLK